ncbi:MAG: DUF192 domain-containing protein [Methanosarcina sp.]|nr:DUF192 domain-containing protein [Methanosarcina sp.]
MIISCKDQIVADRVGWADTFWKRFIGLMGKKAMEKGEGLLLKNCSSIHCFFMRFPIDAVYLSEDWTVLGMETLKPWSLGSRVKKTRHTLELASGSVDTNIIGEKLEMIEDI